MFGKGADIGLLTQAKRPDDGKWHLAHAQFDGHGGKMALESEIHQGSMDDVVLMMAKGYLGASQLLGEVKKLFAALPGTKKAGGLGFEV